MMKFGKNPDEQMYQRVTEKVFQNEGYCPCALLKTPDTLCMCQEFREQKHSGLCHCERFIKTISTEE